MATSKIKKDDMVRVIAGGDKGNEGKVLSVDTEKGKHKAKYVKSGWRNYRAGSSDRYFKRYAFSRWQDNQSRL